MASLAGVRGRCEVNLTHPVSLRRANPGERPIRDVSIKEMFYMAEDFERFVSELQDQIYEETRAAYGEVAFERWLNPLYMGRMESPDGYARVTGPCGDTMEIFLKFEQGCVKEASFQTDGCGSSGVCGSFAAEMALVKDPDALLDVT